MDTKGVMLRVTDIGESNFQKYLTDAFDTIENEEAEEQRCRIPQNDTVEDDDTRKIDGLREKVRNLIGADEFKKLVDDICRVAEFYTDKSTLCKVLCGMSYLISVNRGAGRKILPEILGELTSLLSGYGDKPRTFVHDVTDKKLPDGTMEISSVLRSIGMNTPKNSLYVYILHIDGMLNKFNGTPWLLLMDAIENNPENRLYIFTDPIWKILFFRIYIRE